jgi:hypothetical protein
MFERCLYFNLNALTRQARAIQNELEQQEEKLYQHLCITFGEERMKELVQTSKHTLEKL